MEEPIIGEESELTSQEIGKRTVRSMGTLFSFQFLIKLITRFRTFLIIPFLTATDFGLKSLSLSIFAFAGMPMWGFGRNVLMEEKDIDQMYSAHTTFIFGFTTTIGFVIILFRYSLGKLFDAPLLGKILLVTMSANIFFALGSGAKLKLSREIRHTLAAIVDVIANGLDFFVTIFLAFSGYGVWSLVFGPIVGKTFTTISFLVISKVPSKRFSWAHIVRYYRGGVNYNVLSIFDVILYSSIANFLVGFVSGVSSLGYYSLAFGIALLLTGLIIVPMESVILSAYARMNSKMIRIGLQRTLEFASIFLVGVLLIGISSVKFLIEFFYGKNWLPIAELVQLSLVLAVMLGLLNVFDSYLISQKQTKFLIHVRLFQTGILFGMGLPLTYYFGPVGMIVVQIVQTSVALIAMGKLVSKHFGVNLIKESLYPASVAGLFTTGIVLVGLFLFDTSTLEIVILVILVYGIGIALTGRKVIVALLKLIKHAFSFN